MTKKTGFLIIGIGIASILAGIFSAFYKGDWIDSLSGVFIGVTLIGLVIIERNKKDQPE